MARKKIQKAAPPNYWVPENIPKSPKFRCIVVDPPWIAQRGRYSATSSTIRSRREQEGKLR